MQTQKFQHHPTEANDLAAVFQWSKNASGPTNRAEVLTLSDKICENRNALPLACLYETMILSHKTQSTDALNGGIRRLLSHPRICSDLGELFKREGHMKLAKHAFIEGASYGLQYSTAIYDEMFLSSVGACFTHLLTSFTPANKDAIEKATALAYLYLSHCICLDGEAAAGARHLRAELLHKHGVASVVQQMLLRFLDKRVLPDDMIIADYSEASMMSKDVYGADIDIAIALQHELNVIFGICDNSSFTLKATIDNGNDCHRHLLKMLEHYARNGYFNMEMEELQMLNR